MQVKAFQVGNRVSIPDGREGRIDAIIIEPKKPVKYRVKNDIENWYGDFTAWEIDHV